MSEQMTGAESLVRSLTASGVEVCFTNPGTSEMHMVAAIDKVEGLRPVLGLFEGVVTGAADGYARMTGKPACTLLHLGPGMANGIANLHNASRAHVPIVNIVGDHATFHAKLDAPLASDIAGYARPFSSWLKTATSAATLAQDGAAAVAAARTPPGGIATLIVPADCAWEEARDVAAPLPVPERSAVSETALSAVAEALRSARKPAILMTGEALTARGLAAAGRLAEAFNAKLYCDTFNTRIQRGAGRVLVHGLPYFGEMALEELSKVDKLILVETKAPVAFFAYPNKPSTFAPPDCEIVTLAAPGEDALGALEALADDLAPGVTAETMALALPDVPGGALNADSLGRIFAHFLPENAIVSDEGITAGMAAAIYCAFTRPHDWLQLTGGAIGDGLPMGAGAAVACPERKVVCLQGDGSAMYTVQALWTQAREALDVTTVILANGTYDVLKIEFDRVGVGAPGPKALSMTEIGAPDLNWVQLATGMGVQGFKATTAEEFAKVFAACMKEKGPHLIEAVIPGM